MEAERNEKAIFPFLAPRAFAAEFLHTPNFFTLVWPVASAFLTPNKVNKQNKDKKRDG